MNNVNPNLSVISGKLKEMLHLPGNTKLEIVLAFNLPVNVEKVKAICPTISIGKSNQKYAQHEVTVDELKALSNLSCVKIIEQVICHELSN